MAVDWKVAGSLDQLRDQLDDIFPLRDRSYDGAIGDEDHQNRNSDHNPHYRYANQFWVTARDFTHDPDNGIDCHKLAAALVAAQDRRVKYLIWDGQICSSTWVDGKPPWTWRKYTGPNKHRSHLHVSVRAHPNVLDDRPWLLPGLTVLPAAPLAAPPNPAGGTVIPVQLPRTPWPTNADPKASSGWLWTEEVVSLGYVQGWRGKCMLRLSAGHPGARIIRAHVDIAAGDRSAVHQWPGLIEGVGMYLEPAHRQARELVFEAPKGPAALMVTYAAPGGLSLNVEWER